MTDMQKLQFLTKWDSGNIRWWRRIEIDDEGFGLLLITSDLPREGDG